MKLLVSVQEFLCVFKYKTITVQNLHTNKRLIYSIYSCFGIFILIFFIVADIHVDVFVLSRRSYIILAGVWVLLCVFVAYYSVTCSLNRHGYTWLVAP